MRCNVGVDPSLLADQHVRAEMMEIPMVVGSLKYWNFKIKSTIPSSFNLGAGHMNFLKNKLLYLQRRHESVKKEILRRGFHNDKSKVDLTGVPLEFCNDWSPSISDSMIIRNRIVKRLKNKQIGFWRYNRQKLDQSGLDNLIQNIMNSSLFNV